MSETPRLQQLAEVYAETGDNVVVVTEAPREHTNRYGILKTGADDGIRVKVTGLVEKPKPAGTPSNLSIIGGYVLMQKMIVFLSRMDRSAGNEVQVTNAMTHIIGPGLFTRLRYEGLIFP